MMEPSTYSPPLLALRRPVWIATAITVISCAVMVVQLHRIGRLRTMRTMRTIVHRGDHHRDHHGDQPRIHSPACSGALRVKAFATARIQPAMIPATIPAAADDSDTAMSESSAAALHVASEIAPAITPDIANPSASWGQLGIARIDDKTYAIDRKLVAQIVAAPLTAMRGERIVPAMRDGQARGFKLYHLMANSALTAIGLHNGDTLIAIDGHRLVDRDAGSLMMDWRAKPMYRLLFENRDGRRDVRNLVFR